MNAIVRVRSFFLREFAYKLVTVANAELHSNSGAHIARRMATATGATIVAEPKPMNLLQEFKAFLDKYGVVGLAIAFVIGTALTVLVKAVVADIVMPIVGLVTPGGGWEHAVLYVPSLPAGTDPTAAGFKLPAHTLALAWGDLLAAAINFIIIAAFVFIVAKFLLRQKEVGKI